MEQEQQATLALLTSLIRELQETSILKADAVEAIFDNAIKACLVQENTTGADLLRKLRR